VRDVSHRWNITIGDGVICGKTCADHFLNQFDKIKESCKLTSMKNCIHLFRHWVSADLSEDLTLGLARGVGLRGLSASQASKTNKNDQLGEKL
jgi:hypothetical protein